MMKKFVSLLLSVMLFEIMLGGGGRLTAWGPISLRMILFGMALLTTFILLLRGQKISKEYWVLSITIGIVLAVGFWRGVATGANRVYWWEDIKPLLYFSLLPFFGFAIQNKQLVDQVAETIKQSGIILSCAFFVILVLIHSGVIPFLSFYHWVIDTQEFFFRGELTFFYKGFLYICIATLYVVIAGSKRKFIILIILVAAILLSVTRGFIFATTLTLAFYYLSKTTFSKSLLFVTLGLLTLFIGQTVITKSSEVIDSIRKVEIDNKTPNSRLLGDRNYSDAGRFQQIKEVSAQTTLPSFFIGHGFGQGIPSRSIHMEIAYLEIYHKQGVFGLTFWAFLLWLLYKKYKKTTSDIGDFFFFAALFVYFQSLTNQYLNNPIGLSMILLSIVCLDALEVTERNPTPHLKG